MTLLLRFARLNPNSFASQLLLVFAVALLVPLGFIATLIGSDLDAAEQTANRLAVQQANQAALDIELAFVRDTELATILSGLPDFWNGSDEDRDKILTAFSSPYPSLSGMLYFTDDFEQHGKANYVPGSERQSMAIRAYAQEAVASGQPAFADEITTGRALGRKVLSLVIPLHESEPGLRHGYITAAFLVEQLPSLWDLGSLPEHSSVVLVDPRSGRVIGESLNSPFVMNTVLDPSMLNMVRSDSTSFRVSGADNEWLYTRDPVDGTPWVVLLRMPMSSVLTPIYTVALQRVLMMLGMAVLVSILLLRFWRQMRARFRGLQRAAANWSHGNWSFRTTVLGVDEFAEVHFAFNTMAHQIQDLFIREEQIKQELIDAREVLEQRVQERTSELGQTVAELRGLIEERDRNEIRLRVLGAVSSVMAAGLVDRETLSHVEQLIVPVMADSCGIGWFTEARALEWGVSCGSFARIESSDLMEIVSDACKRRTELVWSSQSADLGRQPDTRVDALAQLGCASVLVVPVVARANAPGVMILGRTNEQMPFTEDDRVWARDVARRIGQAADNAGLQMTIAERGEQLEQLVARLFTAQEEERRQVAYDVHDGLAQIATATHQRLESLAARYHPRSTRTRDDLQRARELAKHTVREARRIIAGLRPAVLDDYGLSAALQQEAEQLRLDGWDVTLVSHLASERLPSSIELALFRVAQEAVTNVRKHAAGAHIRIGVERDGTLIRLDIADDGAGFNVAALDARGAAGHRVGVAGMRERLALLGGRCQVQSRLGGGTKVVAEISVPSMGADGGGARSNES